MEVLLLPIGTEFYALPLVDVREVVAGPRLTRLPGAPASVLGLLNLRGEITPLLDVAVLLGIGHTSEFGFGFAVVIEGAPGPISLATTGMPESDDLGEEVGTSPLPAGRSVHRQGERLATLLAIEDLIPVPVH